MAQVSMQLVKELRERTQAGLSDCKSALDEAGGDVEKAVEIILKRGLAKSAKRAGALALEGEVAARVAADGKSGVLVEVNIQTDFAARNADFRAFVEDVVAAASQAPDGADLGRLPSPRAAGTLDDARQQLVARLGENIQIRRWHRLRVDGPGFVHAYVHAGGKIGALLAIKLGSSQAAQNPELRKLADDLTMQIAAMRPLYLRRADVSEADKAKQQAIFEAQLAEEGKPEQARPKILQGKIDKWLAENCLLEQSSVVETERTVEEVRGGVQRQLGCELELVGFVRYERAEGIEAPTGPDFAAEAAKLAGTD